MIVIDTNKLIHYCPRISLNYDFFPFVGQFISQRSLYVEDIRSAKQ